MSSNLITSSLLHSIYNFFLNWILLAKLFTLVPKEQSENPKGGTHWDSVLLDYQMLCLKIKNFGARFQILILLLMSCMANDKLFYPFSAIFSLLIKQK